MQVFGLKARFASAASLALRANRRPELVRAVEETRKEHPMWGKAKIAAAIAEELRPLNLAASESTVGRILADLVKRGAVEPVWNLRRKALRAARSRRPWARRRPAGHRPERAGDIVQVDSMTAAHRGGRRTRQPVSRLESRSRSQETRRSGCRRKFRNLWPTWSKLPTMRPVA